LSVGDKPTQAIYNVLRTLRVLVSTYTAFTPIVLLDGISWRKSVFPAYKAKREKPAESKHEKQAADLRVQLRKQFPHIKTALQHLGVKQMIALNYEADDLAGLMIARYVPQGRRMLMITGDKDWIQLLGPRCAWIDPVRNLHLTPNTLEEKLGYKKSDGTHVGVPSPRAWLEIKALMGDTSDEIPGVGGIGEKGAIDFIRDYGSVLTFMNGTIDKTIDLATLPKKYKDFAESDEKQDIFNRNIRLMDLNTKERPDPIQPKITHGKLDVKAFAELCEDFAFQTMLTDIEGWCEPFRRAA
jgi:5'-3' exonuclease